MSNVLAELEYILRLVSYRILLSPIVDCCYYEPVGPVAPVLPVGPVSPVLPVWPVEPVDPVLPVGPVHPDVPEIFAVTLLDLSAPFRWLMGYT